MRIVTPYHIETYARCPKRCFFGKNSKPQYSKEAQILQDIIKYCYVYHSRKGKLIPWRFIPSRVYQRLSEALCLTDEGAEYQKTKNLLQRLSIWYNDYYLEKYCDEGLVNLPVQVGLGKRIVYTDTLDIVTMGSQLRIFDFKELHDKKTLSSYNSIEIYNDFVALARIWGFWKASEVKPERYIRLVISDKSIKPYIITITEKLLSKSEIIVRQITRGIEDNVFYPSFSEQCSYCPFREHCSM